ncbi:PREDICTED: synaptotagmin-7-like, partial [Priapulus caudatus]|uniref:Synaptotagmin-7-like n=1 Tax=Priapulus caudatus TaxID=37621 RepID=A0ABM1F7G5_PRICU
EKTGELLMSLCYHPVSSKLVVTVLKGKNLKGKDFFNFSGTKTSDPYVKIWLVQNGKKLEKKKTLVKRVTLHPVFNESFLFIVSADKIRDTALLVSAMDHDRVGRNEVI